MNADYWFGSSFKALQIQSPSTNKNGNFPERAKQLEGPWATTAPTSWGDTEHMQLQLKEWAQHLRWICCQMTDVYREIKSSVWAVCTLKLEFRPTIFIADTRQMTLKLRSFFWIIWLSSYLFCFILYQLNFVSQGEAQIGNSLLITWSDLGYRESLTMNLWKHRAGAELAQENSPGSKLLQRGHQGLTGKVWDLIKARGGQRRRN